MMKTEGGEEMLDQYLIIHKSILPEYYEKVLEARHLLEDGRIKDVSQAVREVGISRSTYYKYRTISWSRRISLGDARPCSR